MKSTVKLNKVETVLAALKTPLSDGSAESEGQSRREHASWQSHAKGPEARDDHSEATPEPPQVWEYSLQPLSQFSYKTDSSISLEASPVRIPSGPDHTLEVGK